MALIVLVVSFFLLVFLNVPICFSLGASSILYLAMAHPEFLILLPQRVWAGSENFLLIALPLFMLAGELMNRGGITKRIIDFATYVVRPIGGGLGEVNVVDSMIFGGISGSSIADVSATGTVIIPAMVERGYPKGFAVGITVASSTMGMIIPPSIPMLLYAMMSGESVGALFLAGMIPGILVGVTQLVLVNTISRRKHYLPEKQKLDLRHFVAAVRNGFFAMLMPVMIIVTVTFGIATATESAGAAVFYALILGFLVYRELKLKDVVQIMKSTVLASSSLMLIIAFSMMFVWILAIEKIPTQIGDFVVGLNLSKFWILLGLDIFLLVIGTFIDVGSAIILVSPVLIEVMRGVGMGAMQLGAVIIVGLAIGLCTPPVGGCLFACNRITGMPVTEIAKHALPFLVGNVVVLILVTFVPEVSLWLPALLMK
jgi:tripartite ATP-independent transporter DctM subunit